MLNTWLADVQARTFSLLEGFFTRLAVLVGPPDIKEISWGE